MNSRFSPTIVASLLQEVRSNEQSSNKYTELIALFKPTIKRLATGFPFSWRSDFIQEGTIGLISAIKTYSVSADPLSFIYYATFSIKSRMINFYGAAIKRQPEIDGSARIITVDDEQDEPVIQFPSSTDYATSITLKLDIDCTFSQSGMLTYGFLPKEITAFTLHFLHDYKIIDVADMMHLSVSQASKLISHSRIKAHNLVGNLLNYESQKSF